MSIAKQIVDLSAGTIDVRSALGKGTEITLSLPLENCPLDPESALLTPKDSSYPYEDPITAVRRRSQGWIVTIRGFEVEPGSSELQLTSLSSLKASIEKYITEWFQLEISSEDATADILVCDESALLHSSATQLKFQSLLILCSNSARRDIYSSQLDRSQSIEFVSKPCGPHRLVKSLLNCFDTEDALRIQPDQPVSQMRSCNRVTFPEPLAHENAILTVDTGKSLRLNGHLQSKIIGFSPTTNLNRAPKIDNKTEGPLKRGLDVREKESTREAYRLRKENSSPNSAAASNEIPEVSSTCLTPNNSTNRLEDDE